MTDSKFESRIRIVSGALYTKGAFFYSQFWNENGQNVKCARFSIPHSYSGMDRMPFHPFCSQGRNEQNVANEIQDGARRAERCRFKYVSTREKNQVTLLDKMKHCF